MWIRCDFDDDNSKFISIISTFEEFSQSVLRGDLIEAQKSMIFFPHKGKDGKEGLAAIQLKDSSPLYMVCKQEWVNTKYIRSFGIVDEDANAWKIIVEKATGEKQILTPNKEIFLK